MVYTLLHIGLREKPAPGPSWCYKPECSGTQNPSRIGTYVARLASTFFRTLSVFRGSDSSPDWVAGSPAAVRALLDGGAALRQPNKSGSTPLHLAVQNTGASGSGSEEAHRHQEQIIRLLLERGARPTDQDSHGKSVEQAATSEWVRALLAEAKKLPGD